MRRVGVLTSDDSGTCVVPGLMLGSEGRSARVLIERGGELVEESVALPYAEPPLPETAELWADRYTALEAAAKDGRYC